MRSKHGLFKSPYVLLGHYRVTRRNKDILLERKQFVFPLPTHRVNIDITCVAN